MTKRPPEPPDPMVLLIKALGLTDAILATHIPDHETRVVRYCVSCSGNRMIVWPCALHFFATEARKLGGGGK